MRTPGVVPPPPVHARVLSVTERPAGTFRIVFLDNNGVTALLALPASEARPGVGQAVEVLVGERGWPIGWRRA
jgi:hypothetical protein